MGALRALQSPIVRAVGYQQWGACQEREGGAANLPIRGVHPRRRVRDQGGGVIVRNDIGVLRARRVEKSDGAKEKAVNFRPLAPNKRERGCPSDTFEQGQFHGREREHKSPEVRDETVNILHTPDAEAYRGVKGERERTAIVFLEVSARSRLGRNVDGEKESRCGVPESLRVNVQGRRGRECCEAEGKVRGAARK
jgi:hypothetical protein